MTVVVRFGFGDYPMLISDLLLSGPEPLGQKFAIPTVGDVKTVFGEGSGFTPTRLNQKVALIGDDLVLAWTGSRLEARTIIKELIEKNMQQPLSKDSLADYFKSVDPRALKAVGFLGFLKEASGIIQLGLNCETFASELFGEVGFLGSGSNDIKPFFEELPEFPIPPKQKLSMQAVSNSFALSLSGLLLSIEIANRRSLLQFYGGGYEIVTAVEGNFRKLDDVTYLFWFVQVIDDKIGLSLDRVFKYSYQDDVLIIRTEDLTPSENMKGLILTNSFVSVVPPV
jgi:hypothetical protein